MKRTYTHMADEEFLELLDNYGDGHTAIHEAATRIRRLLAAQHRVQRTACKHGDFISDGKGSRCQDCGEYV